MVTTQTVVIIVVLTAIVIVVVSYLRGYGRRKAPKSPGNQGSPPEP